MATRERPLPGSEAPHVVIIDDEPQILELLGSLLLDEGYRVSASTALPSLEAMATLRPDIVVQDLVLAGSEQEAWTFLAQAQHDPRLASIPKIVCTVDERVVKDPVVAAQFAALGVQVILKPFDLTEMLTVLADSLRSRPSAVGDDASGSGDGMAMPPPR